MTYMVMETHLSYCVVMDEAGRFLKAANRSYEIGQVVERIVPLSRSEKKAIPLRVISAVGGVAACFALVFSVYWSNFITPFASIYLSINPHVQMEISRRDTVVGLKGLNEDGVLLIEGYGYRGKSIELVANELVDRAIDMGFLSDGGMVSINIDAPDEIWFESKGIGLRRNLNEYLSERMSVTIEVRRYTEPSEPAFKDEPASSPSAVPTQTPQGNPPASDPPPSGAPQPQPSAAPAQTPPPPAATEGGDSGYDDLDNDSGYGENDSAYADDDGDDDDGDDGG